MLRTRLLAALAAVVSPIVLSTAAHGDAPGSLSPLRVSPQTSAPQGTVVIAGGGCVGTGGTIGVVTVSLQNPDGTAHTGTVADLDASGGWAAQYTAPSVPGSYAITTTCDLYGSTLSYPASMITVDGAGGGTPPAGGTAPAHDPSSTAPAPNPGANAAPPANPGNYPAADDQTLPSGTGGTTPTVDDLAATGAPLTGLGGLTGALVVSGLATAIAGRRRRV